MAFVFRKITKKIFIIINLVTAFLFLLACCNAFLNPQTWWFIALLGLPFPFLFIITVLFLVFWLIIRSKWAILPAVCLLLSYPHIRAVWGLNYGKTFSEKKPENALRILTWNVTWFDEQTRADKTRRSYRDDMLKFIKESDADILCFQEYVELNNKNIHYNNRNDITALGYPYNMVVYDYIGWKAMFQSGVAIFSKYPITDSMRLIYPGPKNFRAAESLINVDINVNDRPIRIFTTHLQSVMFQPNDYRNLQIIKSASDSMYEAGKSIINKLGMGYKFRGRQADIVRRNLDASPYPAIICGDFNDVPNSYTYFRIKGDRKDAFREAGKGIGRTFTNISPTLRIDYIMTDKRFDVLQYKRYFLPYSEHYPVIADVRLRDSAD